MEKFIRHRGIGVPLRQTDIDTDQIVPGVYLKRITKTGYDDALFARWRTDPDFVLNQDPFCRGSVLVTGADFGAGSSREHAVWALRDYGFSVVVAPRFGDIFRGNAGKQGLLTAQVEQADVEEIWRLLEAEPGTEIDVDLDRRRLACGELVTSFMIDDHTRWRLMEGLDDIALTLQRTESIDAYESSRPPFRPATLPPRT